MTTETDAAIEAGLLERARRLAKGRVSAAQHYEGIDLDTAVRRWFPRVAGEAVTIKHPEETARGYSSRSQALEAAREYRERCRSFVAKAEARHV